MAQNYPNSPPFVLLTKQAEDFKKLFDDNISDCLSTFSTSIASLICEPEGGRTFDKKQKRNSSAFEEFSKAKQNIFVDMESLLETYQKDWEASLSGLKGTFLETVKIFLAKTKLEVKLPAEIDLTANVVNEAKKYKRNTVSSRTSIYPALKDLEILKREVETLNLPSTSALSVEENEISEDDSDTDCKVIEQSGRRAFQITPMKMDPKKLASTLDDILNESIDFDQQYYSEPPKPSPMRRTIFRTPKGYTSFLSSNAEAESSGARRKTGTPSTPAKYTPRTLRKGLDVRKDSQTPGKLIDIDMDVDSEVETEPEMEVPVVYVEDLDIPEELIYPERYKSKPVSENLIVAGSRAEIELKKTPVSTRRKTTLRTLRIGDMEDSTAEIESTAKQTPVNTRRKTVFPTLSNDMGGSRVEIECAIKRTPASTRRKTVMKSMLKDDVEEISSPKVTAARGRAKRKTIAGGSDVTVSYLSKRLKSSEDESEATTSKGPVSKKDFNLIEIGDKTADDLTHWVPMQYGMSIAPRTPGVYELKVGRAKKAAFIGSSQNLKETFVAHMEDGRSGNKHLDKYMERNKAGIEVRFKDFCSLNEAKAKAQERIQSYFDLHKTTPAYN